MKKFIVWFPDFPEINIKFSNCIKAKEFCKVFKKEACINEINSTRKPFLYSEDTIYSNGRR